MSTTIEIDWNHTGTWIDETSRTRRIQIRTGFEHPLDAVAGIGGCTIRFDNSTRRFSPGNTAGPLYGKLLPRRQVRIATGGTVLFRGYIERIVPESGGDEVVIECVDGIALLKRQRVGVVYESSKSVTAAITDLVNAAYSPPALDIHDNGDNLDHYGQAWKPEETTCLDAIRQICESVYGRFFVARDGTATFITRADQQNPPALIGLEISGTAVPDEMLIRLDVDSVINCAQITVYPVETVGAIQEIWCAQTILRIAPGQTREIYANFRDDNGERCGAVEVIAPVATTDYTVNERRDGSGGNYTTHPAFSLSTEIEATRMKITLSNTATGALYMTLLKVRGKPIRVYDPITLEQNDTTSQTAYEIRARAFDLPMQPDPVFGQALAEYLVGRYKDPALVVESLRVQGRGSLGAVNLYALELLDKLLITDSSSGASSLAHWIRAIDYDLPGHGIIFWLERADDRIYWRLDHQKLNQTTRLGL